MARHRRSTPVPAGATGAGRHRGGHRRHSPVRTGLVASSAALAIGAVAMGAGVVPAPPGASDGLSAVGDPNTGGTGIPLPAGPGTGAPDSQGGTTAPASEPPGTPGTQPGGRPGSAPPERTPVPPSRGGDRPAAPADTASPAPSPSVPAPPSTVPGDTGGNPDGKPPGTGEPSQKPGDGRTSPPAPHTPSISGAERMESAVLVLVNAERAKAGCDPLKLNRGLARLARTFAVDMALRGFFSHVNPDGDNPWDRAGAAGIGDLGGENIARGQADAQAVMDAWMSSEGHRANMLNCDFKSLGVGAHFGVGGPWWVQSFGL